MTGSGVFIGVAESGDLQKAQGCCGPGARRMNEWALWQRMSDIA